MAAVDVEIEADNRPVTSLGAAELDEAVGFELAFAHQMMPAMTARQMMPDMT